jgi:hypothetical protein
VAVAVIVVGAWLYQFARGRWPRRADLALIGVTVLAAAVLIVAGDYVRRSPEELTGWILAGL